MTGSHITWSEFVMGVPYTYLWCSSIFWFIFLTGMAVFVQCLTGAWLMTTVLTHLSCGACLAFYLLVTAFEHMWLLSFLKFLYQGPHTIEPHAGFGHVSTPVLNSWPHAFNENTLILFHCLLSVLNNNFWNDYSLYFGDMSCALSWISRKPNPNYYIQ